VCGIAGVAGFDLDEAAVLAVLRNEGW